jgi:hypothetical protein
VPSLLRGLRLSKLFGRKGVIHSSPTADHACPRTWRAAARIPGFRDIRGYRAMYQDFHRAILTGAAPEMSLERAMDDQRVMDQIYASLAPAGPWRLRGRCGPNTSTSSSLGAAPAGERWPRAGWHRCARARRRARRGHSARAGELESRKLSGSSCAIARPSAGWTGAAIEFLPYTHYCVGGNTKFWGSVLYRLRREDFCATEHVDGVSPAWPITYETLAPYYEQAERLYHVTASAVTIRPSRLADHFRFHLSRMQPACRRLSNGCASRVCIRRRCHSD